MARYIDADKMFEHINEEMANGFPSDENLSLYALSVLAHQPTADVVEVVRCCKCKNYEYMKSSNEHFCNEYGGRVTENDFCSRAILVDSKEKKVE